MSLASLWKKAENPVIKNSKEFLQQREKHSGQAFLCRCCFLKKSTDIIMRNKDSGEKREEWH